MMISHFFQPDLNFVFPLQDENDEKNIHQKSVFYDFLN